MKKVILILCAFVLMFQSVTFTKAQEKNEQRLNTYQALDDISTSVESKSLHKVPFTQNVVLPERYDAREDGIVTSIKNQSEFGVCWAYSLVSVAETQFLKKGYASNPEDVNFNELQMAYGFYHRKDDPLGLTPNDNVTAIGNQSDTAYLTIGGNHQLSSYYLAQWASLADEEDFPNTNAFANLPNDLANHYTYDNVSFIMTDAHYLPNDDVQAIKEAIYQYGSVGSAYFSDGEYYNPYIFHDDEGMQVNHAITLVGWDDTIKKEAFAESNEQGLLPSRDGAWIMKNSWGTYAGEEGYFYLSYDMHLDTTTAFEFEKREAYDNNYFYDGGYEILYWNPYGLKKMQAANVFKAQKANEETIEKVTAASIAIASSNTNYSVQVYRLNENFSSPTDGEAVLNKPVTGFVKYPGSYTVEIEEAVELNENENFSIVVTLESENPQIYLSEDYDFTGFVSGVDTNGEKMSYMYSGRNWTDLDSLRSGCVARIRAYTKEEAKSVVRGQLKALIKTLQAFQQSEECDYLSSITYDTFNGLIEEATIVANDVTLSDNDYQNAIDALNEAYKAVQKEVSEVKQKENIYAAKVDEVNEWVNGPDGYLLTASEYSKILSALYHASDVLASKHQIEIYDSELSTLELAWNEAKEIINNRKGLRNALTDSIAVLQNIIVGEDVGYFKESRINEANALITQAQKALENNDETDIKRSQTSIDNKINQINTEITTAKTKQNELVQLFEELNTFMMDYEAFLLEEQKETLNTQKAVYEPLFTQKVTAEIYQEAYLSLSSTYFEIQIDATARKEAFEKAHSEAVLQLQNGIAFYEENDLSIYTQESVLLYSDAYQAATDLLNSQTTDIEALIAAANLLKQRYAELELLIMPPARVENVKVEDTDYKTITLSWDVSEHASVYDVYRKSYDSEEFKLYKTVEEPTLTVSGVMTGKEYAFYIVARNEKYESEVSETVVKATSLHGKVTLSMEQVSVSKFKLNWTAVDGATRYIEYRKRNDDSFKKVLTLGAKELEYTTAEMPNGNYQFIIKAGRYDSKDRVMSDASNTVKGKVEEIKPKVTLTAQSKAIKVAWNKMEGVTHYEVYRSTSKEGKYTKLTTTTSTSYTSKSLTKGKAYYFKVKGYKQYKSGDTIKYNVYTPDSDVKTTKAK